MSSENDFVSNSHVTNWPSSTVCKDIVFHIQLLINRQIVVQAPVKPWSHQNVNIEKKLKKKSFFHFILVLSSDNNALC